MSVAGDVTQPDSEASRRLDSPLAQKDHAFPITPPTPTRLRKHSVVPGIEEDRADSEARHEAAGSNTRQRAATQQAAAQHEPLTVEQHEPAVRDDHDGQDEGRLARPWPPHQKVWGVVSLSVKLLSASSRDARMSVHYNVLTVHIGSDFDHLVSSIPLEHLVVTLLRGQFEMLILSCTTDRDGDAGIICRCKDQTARNKWLYVLRRVLGVAVRPLRTLSLRPLASSSAETSPIYPSTSRSPRTTAAEDGPSRAQEDMILVVSTIDV